MISRSRRPRRGLTATALAAVLTLLLSVLAACGSSSSEGDGDAIRIGAVLPLTGPAAELGQSWKAGVELAVDRINDEGGIEIDGTKHEVSVKIAEHDLLPAAAAHPDAVVLADGFSCRTQLAELAGRDAVTLAELLLLRGSVAATPGTAGRSPARSSARP